MYSVLAIFLLFLGIGLTFELVDYCTAPLCDNNVRHVACNPDLQNNFSSKCVLAKQINLDKSLQQIILDQHNLKRSQVATGNLSGFPTASQMKEMTWDPELAHIAGFNVRTCKMEHDACRSTYAFPYAGQNLAKMSQSQRFSDPKDMLILMIGNMWFGEYKDCPVELVKSFKLTSTVVGHFTAMIQQKSGRVGCAMTQFKENDMWFVTLLACNYSYTNMMETEIYAVGPPCSKCVSKCSSKYPGLCV